MSRAARLARLEVQAMPTPAELARMTDGQLNAYLERLDRRAGSSKLADFQKRLEAMTDGELLSEWHDLEARQAGG